MQEGKVEDNMNSYENFMKIQIISADPEYAEGYMEIRKELTDELSHTAGGAYNSLADAVGGAAARATGDMYVTQGCSLQFYESTEIKDAKLFAKATIRHRGSRTCIC